MSAKESNAVGPENLSKEAKGSDACISPLSVEDRLRLVERIHEDPLEWNQRPQLQHLEYTAQDAEILSQLSEFDLRRDPENKGPEL